jgi:hypothetical protein
MRPVDRRANPSTHSWGCSAHGHEPAFHSAVNNAEIKEYAAVGVHALSDEPAAFFAEFLVLAAV